MMTKSIMTGTCAAIVGLSAMLGAQAATTPQQAPTPTPQAQTTAPPPAQTTSSEKRITVTGCLKADGSSSADATGAATTGATGTTGTTGTTAAGTAATGTSGAGAATADAKFLLTDAAASSADATGAAGTSSAATASGSAGTSASTAKTYRLIANPSALSPHVGKKLELTGTLSDEGGAEAANGSTASEPEANAPKLKVESGKVVAASCQP